MALTTQVHTSNLLVALMCLLVIVGFSLTGCLLVNAVSNDRFQSMFSLWTILSFNILLVGDFAKLNPFVMQVNTRNPPLLLNYLYFDDISRSSRHLRVLRSFAFC
jgi:hypothetical protein